MPDPKKVATISAGGNRYTSWKGVTVQRDYKNGVSVFQFTASESTNKNRSWSGLFLKPGDAVTIALGGVQVINGYVTKRSVSYDKESHELVIQGKSLTCDVVDSSVIIKPGDYKGYNIQQIANGVMQPHGIKMVMQNPPSGWDQPFDYATPHYGETCFAFISRLASHRGLFLCDDKDGNLTAGQGNPSAAVAAELQEGRNIEWATGTLDDENAWSTTGMIATHPLNDQTWEDGSTATAIATNDTTRANRVRLVNADHAPNSSQDLVTRTNFENAITSATIVEAEITVAGWFRPDGQLWQPCDNISVLSPMLFPMVDGPVNLAVQSTTFSQNERGTTTTLKVVQPWHLTTMIDANAPQSNPTDPVSNPAPTSAQPVGVDSPFAFTS